MTDILKEAEVIDWVKRANGQEVPLLNIKMMDEATEKETGKKHAVMQFRRHFGFEPETVDLACHWWNSFCWVTDFIKEFGRTPEENENCRDICMALWDSRHEGAIIGLRKP